MMTPVDSDEFARKARGASAAWKSRIGTAVKIARERKAMSQGALADLIGASVSTISEIERGVTLPTLATAWTIADRLAVPIDILVGRSTEDEIASQLTQPTIADEAESLGRTVGLLQLSLEKAIEKIGELELRLASLETGQATSSGPRRKHA